MLKRLAAWMLGLACLWGVTAETARAAAAPRAPAFKGEWQGPSGPARLPGPGPAAGQSVGDYMASLTTGPRSPRRFKVLVLGGTRGFHHDSASAAMAAVYRWGQETGLWEAELATDFALVNGQGGGRMNAGFQPKGLKDFDAVVVANASGDWGLSSDQQAALESFVRDGKGMVVIHAGIDSNHGWRGYIDMVGGEFVGHPFNTVEDVLVNFPMVNEDPSFPAVAHLPRAFRKQDEIYVLRNWLRPEVNVVLRLDETKLDYTGREQSVRPDRDFAVAWAKSYGKGRVFASSIGHAKEAFTDPDVERMYAEAIKWALGLTDGAVTSHSRRN